MLRVLKEHYQKLGKERHVEAFDSDWEDTCTNKN